MQTWAQTAAPRRSAAPAQVPTSNEALPAGWKPKICYVADSIGFNVDFKLLEKATGAVIKKTKAYCSKFGGKMPTKNFTDIIPQVLNEDRFDYLVVQASSTDLTNLQELPEDTCDEYYRQQASLSSYQMVSSLDTALTAHPYLKGVVLMERTPRYDDLHNLNRYANGVLHEAVSKSRNAGKVFVGQHILECEGGVQASRLGSPSTHHNFDGIHLRGSSGRIATTRSVASILQQAGILSSPLQVTVPSMSSGRHSQESFQPAGSRRGFNNPARRQQQATRSQGMFQKAQQQQQSGAPVPLMEQEVNIPTQNRYQGFC